MDFRILGFIRYFGHLGFIGYFGILGWIHLGREAERDDNFCEFSFGFGFGFNLVSPCFAGDDVVWGDLRIMNAFVPFVFLLKIGCIGLGDDGINAERTEHLKDRINCFFDELFLLWLREKAHLSFKKRKDIECGDFPSFEDVGEFFVFDACVLEFFFEGGDGISVLLELLEERVILALSFHDAFL